MWTVWGSWRNPEQIQQNPSAGHDGSLYIMKISKHYKSGSENTLLGICRDPEKKSTSQTSKTIFVPKKISKRDGQSQGFNPVTTVPRNSESCLGSGWKEPTENVSWGFKWPVLTCKERWSPPLHLFLNAEPQFASSLFLSCAVTSDTPHVNAKYRRPWSGQEREHKVEKRRK